VPNIISSASSNGDHEVQDNGDVKEIREIEEETTTDPAAISDLGTSSGADLLPEETAPAETASVPATVPAETAPAPLGASPGSPRGGQDLPCHLLLRSCRVQDLLRHGWDQKWLHRLRQVIRSNHKTSDHILGFKVALSNLKYTLMGR
jgi:hypothetical protein